MNNFSLSISIYSIHICIFLYICVYRWPIMYNEQWPGGG